MRVQLVQGHYVHVYFPRSANPREATAALVDERHGEVRVTVRAHPKDRVSYPLGRKIALTRLLREEADLGIFEEDIRENRRRIWTKLLANGLRV